jgi:subtilisin family serine protease
MRATRLTSRLLDVCCCFLSYVLVISLCARLAARRLLAATPNAERKASSATPPKAITQSNQQRAGELIIRFREGVSEQDKNATVNARGIRRKKVLRGQSRIEKLELAAGQEPEALAAELRSLPAVELVEPNFLISRNEITPDDPRFSEQWALKNTGQNGGVFGSDIGAALAWETTTGAPTTTVAIVDSGVDFTHPDLRNNQWANSRERDNNRDEDRNGFTDDLYGWDWIANDNSVHDEQGHGTAIAGIIAAQGNNRIGITGVMWKAALMSLRVLDNTGTGDVADAVEAIDYAVEHGAQVITCSWGTEQESAALRDAIERAGRAGVVVVSSAGNSGRDIESEPYYPASYSLPNQIVVAATDKFDLLASWSNYGNSHITIAAPGTDILTTRIGGGYTIVTGTSASTPLVTGVVGLIKTQRWWLSAAGTRAAIMDGARRVEGLIGKVSAGGIVNASGALAALRGPNTPPPGNGNGGNNGGGNGNGNGGNPHVQPPTPGHGSGGSGSGGSFSITPPPVTQGIPGSLPPNLDEVRRRQPTTPKAPAPIHADICPDCDPGGGTPPPSGGSDPYFATARVRPENETGQQGIDLGSRNFNWSLPLVSLPGRSGLGLNLAITYNSLVWTKQGNSIMFNADRGFPSPGFQLGVPRLELGHINQDGIFTAYLLVMPSGQRVELRQVGTSNVYESTNSSYTQLLDYNLSFGGSAVVRTTDGTQYTFTWPTGVHAIRCTQVKDRNGNYISINYNANGQISTIVDTLARTVTLNYVNDYLSSITQTWNGQTHTWATFGYGSVYVQAPFPGMNYYGPSGHITVLTQVGLHDGTRYNFNYTPFAQVYKISHYAADQHLLKYTGYNLPGSEWLGSYAHNDCPRFTERRDWAENWNNGAEAITYYSVDPNSAGGNQPAWSQVTTPDGTVYKELYATTGWQKGLITGTEVWVGGVKKKLTNILWTQDDTSLTYQKNPRPYDLDTYDEANNRRHIDIIYTSFGLPGEVREYSVDGSGFGGFMRRTYTGYRFDQAYIDRRIIGLVNDIHVVDENNNYVTKITYDYDRGEEYLVGTSQPATQHDAVNYGAGFVYGRGNQTDVWHWDVTDINNPSKAIRQQHTGYNTTGSVVFERDALNHQITISYTDYFSDGVNRNTFAYPTTVTDADNFSSTSQYNYDFGATTRAQDPKGAVATMTYDAAGRIERVTNQVNGAYTRWVYNPYGDVATFTTVQSGLPEAFSVTYFDGAGQLRSNGGDLPNSSGGYVGQFTLYDIMGRPSQQSNPAEMTHLWAPTGDDAVGWVWTYQAYNWQGKPTLTTNPDGTTRENIYGGCGCAGGEVVTTRDERG